MTNEINPELLFDIENADDLEPLPEGSTITVHGPGGDVLAEIDTADAGTFAHFCEETLVDGAGQSETVRGFYVRHRDR